MIADAFMFSNEFECLEVRLHELADVVDYFVLVEADFTFQGGTKPLRFLERADEFEAWPIMHVRLSGPVEASDPWQRESLQRNCISEGLDRLALPDDSVVLVGDCDEVPRGECVELAAAELADGADQVAFRQALSFYHVDNRCWSTWWWGTQAVLAGNLARRGAQDVRDRRNTSSPVPLDGLGGWHFCNLGGPERIIEKLESFSHDEVNLPEYKDRAFLEAAIESGQEMTGRTDVRFSRVSIDDLPRHLLEHRGRFRHLFSPRREPLPKGGGDGDGVARATGTGTAPRSCLDTQVLDQGDSATRDDSTLDSGRGK